MWSPWTNIKLIPETNHFGIPHQPSVIKVLIESSSKWKAVIKLSTFVESFRKVETSPSKRHYRLRSPWGRTPQPASLQAPSVNASCNGTNLHSLDNTTDILKWDEMIGFYSRSGDYMGNLHHMEVHRHFWSVLGSVSVKCVVCVVRFVIH